MRRARRNCERGWVALACQDYQAIARGSSAATAEITTCPTTLARDAVSHRSREQP